MNIHQAKNEIINTVKAYLRKDKFGNYEIPSSAQRPLLLIGAAGIGKTAVMKQAAQECGINLVAYTITHHTRQSAVGLPFIKEKSYGGKIHSITEYTMSEIIASVYDAIEETGIEEGILFIDEINCVSETLAPTMLQFLQFKTFGTHKVPDGFIIAAAGNPPEYNKAVREFDIATLDRVRLINVEPDLKAWLEYAENKDIHPSIVSYVSAKQSDFYRTEKTGNGLEFMTPRAWEDLSYLLKEYEKINIPLNADITGEYIKHSEINKSFYAYYALFSKYKEEYSVLDILGGKLKKSEKLSNAPFDEKLVIINMICSKLNEMFETYIQEDSFTDMLYENLKDLKSKIQSCDIIKTLEEMRSNLKREIFNLKKSSFADNLNFLSKIRLEKTLGEYIDILKGSVYSDSAEAFETLKSSFNKQLDNKEDLVFQILNCLENAYSFLENTFEGLREIVILTTKLTAHKNAFRFLSENKCEKYYKYNKELLFDEKHKSISSEIENYRQTIWQLEK